MPGLFSAAVKRLNDAVEYHAEYLANTESGHRDKYGRKTERWYDREEEAARRRRHRHRRHRDEGEEEVKEVGDGAAEDGLHGQEAEAGGEGEGEAVAPREENSVGGGGHRHHHQRHHHSSRGGEHDHRHRRHHDSSSDAGVEILDHGDGPLGRELPPEEEEESRRPRQRERWVDKKTGREVSPPQKVEMRPWLRKLLKRDGLKGRGRGKDTLQAGLEGD